MKFGNPISDVNATITGGEISLAAGASVGISGGQLTDANGNPSQPVLNQVPVSFYGSSSDGDVTINSNTTLLSPKQYSNLTVNASLTTPYPVYIAGILSGTGNINNNGLTGLSNGQATNGTTAGTFPSSGAGGKGGNYGNLPTAGSNGNPASGAVQWGGNGGSSYAAGGIVPIAGASIAIGIDLFSSLLGTGAGGGGGSASGQSNYAGGGGSGGSVCAVAAKIISGNITIQANGGDGGIGRDGYASYPTGMPGGGGGGGGIAILVYSFTANGWMPYYVSANGGNGGLGGFYYNSQNRAASGNPGNPGSAYSILTNVASS